MKNTYKIIEKEQTRNKSPFEGDGDTFANPYYNPKVTKSKSKALKKKIETKKQYIKRHGDDLLKYETN